MSLTCPMHTDCETQRRVDAVFPAAAPRCNTIWCKYFDYQFDVEETSWAPLEEMEEPLGFRNVGNCCYVNAILRALFSLEDLCLELEAGLATVVNETHWRPIHPVVECFQQLLLKSGTAREGKLVDVIHNHFIDALYLVNARFVRGEQQDASDFFLELYNFFAEALPSESTTRLSQYFEGVIRQNVVCNICLHESETMQRMVIWPLPMTRRGYTLDDCLTNYLADADMSDRECFRCGNREAVMKRTVVSWPRVFVICLQRFSNGAKDEAPICFSEIWQPREKDVEPDREYILQAVVTHLGQTIECGHYVCQCRGSDGVIRSFNDDRVTSKLWDEYAAEAYLLFFVEQ